MPLEITVLLVDVLVYKLVRGGRGVLEGDAGRARKWAEAEERREREGVEKGRAYQRTTLKSVVWLGSEMVLIGYLRRNPEHV